MTIFTIYWDKGMHFTFLRANIQSVVCCKVYHSFQNHHVNRALVVETCCEEKINANLLSKSQILPAEVRETEQTTLNALALFTIIYENNHFIKGRPLLQLEKSTLPSPAFLLQILKLLFNVSVQSKEEGERPFVKATLPRRNVSSVSVRTDEKNNMCLLEILGLFV